MSEIVGYDFLSRPLHAGDLVYWGDLEGQALAQVAPRSNAPIDEFRKNQVPVQVFILSNNKNVIESQEPWWVQSSQLAYFSSDYHNMSPAYIANLLTPATAKEADPDV